MLRYSEKLENFVATSKMTGRGALCVALVVTRHAKRLGLPLDDAALLTENVGIAASVECFDIEQFLASNILELSRFKAASQRMTVENLVKRYNRLALCENNPGLLIQDK